MSAAVKKSKPLTKSQLEILTTLRDDPKAAITVSFFGAQYSLHYGDGHRKPILSDTYYNVIRYYLREAGRDRWTLRDDAELTIEWRDAEIQRRAAEEQRKRDERKAREENKEKAYRALHIAVIPRLQEGITANWAEEYRGLVWHDPGTGKTFVIREVSDS